MPSPPSISIGTLPLLLLLSQFAISSLPYCPPRCSCAHSTVICTGLGLSQVPKGIPAETTRLDLTENRIRHIRADDFAGLGQLRMLHLGDNLIETIDPGAFSPLTRLERLRLSRNRIRSMPEGLFAENKLIKRLDLSENNLWSLTTQQLAGPVQLVTLQLERNQLQCLDSLALNRWPSLEHLSLASNALSSLAELDLASLPRLSTLRLSDNPWHCDCRLRWLKRLKVANQIRCHRPSLLFGRSLDKISIKQLKCSGLEKRASGGGGKKACREVDWCPAGCSCTEVGPDQLVVDCHDRQLRTVPERLPPNTVELRLEQNRITRLDNHSFEHVPRLARLDLSKNAIGQIQPDAFSGLNQLTSLMLFANNLTDLPSSIFRPLPSLQVLLLNGNRLQCLRTGLFDGLTQLRLLSLYDNQIRAIAQSTFVPLANSLQTLHLARNPLICDCNLQWLVRLLSARPIETSGARCHSPRRVARRRIGTLPVERLQCMDPSEGMMTEGAGECRVDNGCPEQCQCWGTVVDCRGRRLSSPPQGIPRFATALLLANNQIAEFPALGELPNLHFLDLSDNRVAAVHPNSLPSLGSLRKLDLRNNSLRRFSISQDTANAIQTLLLDGNSLRCLSSLHQFPSLRHLSLRQNPRLISLHVGPLHDLDQLDLDSAGQWLCDCQLRSLVQLVRKIDGKNGTAEEGGGPKCAEPVHLRGRMLAHLDERELPCQSDFSAGHCSADGEFCPHGCVCSLPPAASSPLIVRCSNSSLTQIPWGLPPNTGELLLDHNRIDRIEPDYFTGLTQLTKLDLSHNRLEHILPNAFAPLPSLSSLILANNQIRCLADAAFHGLPSLRLLSLHANRLSQLPESAFSTSLLANLSHIALGSNPLWCDCQMNWAGRWMRSKFVEPGIARCDGPPTRRLQLLLTADPFSPCPSAPPPASILAKCHPCLANPCANSAQCHPLLLLPGQFHCQCPPGFHGKLCGDRVDACFGQPCQNGGSCQIREAEQDQGRFHCQCVPGFVGERCEREKDECMEGGGNERCLNGGTCRDELNNFHCDCAPGWTGEHCEQHICSAHPPVCLNQAQCLPLSIPASSANSSSLLPFRCICLDGFHGPNCADEATTILLSSMDEEEGERDGQMKFNGVEEEEGSDGIELDEEKRALRAERAHTESPKLASTSSNSQNCAFDVAGQNCSTKRAAICMDRPGAFLQLGEWAAPDERGDRHLEMKFKTSQRGGVLFWLGHGDAAHFLLLELVQGRLRAALQLGTGHSPPSQLFSLAPVNDGHAHSLSIRLHGQRLSLRLDDASLPLQSVLNSGPLPNFPSAPAPLFLGGISADLGRRALVQFRLSDSSSVRGCFWDIRLDNARHSLDLAQFIGQHSSPLVNIANLMEMDNAKMDEGRANGRRRRKCAKKRHGRGKYWTEGKCRSAHPMPNCVGQCQEEREGEGGEGRRGRGCCGPLAMKRRRILLKCSDGTQKWGWAEMARRCGCGGGGGGGEKEEGGDGMMKEECGGN